MNSIAEAPQRGKAVKSTTASMFPQYRIPKRETEAKRETDGNVSNEGSDEASPQLRKCLRFLPHLSNTGRFYGFVLSINL